MTSPASPARSTAPASASNASRTRWPRPTRVAAHITGQAAADPEIPWFWTVQHGVRLQTAGVRHPDDEVVVRGNPNDGKFSVAYLRNGRLAAVDTIAGLTDFRPAKKLIAQKARIDPHSPPTRLPPCLTVWWRTVFWLTPFRWTPLIPATPNAKEIP